MSKKVKTIITVILIIIMIPILFVSAVILIDSYAHPDKVPSFFSWKPFIVLSGSMETQISAGDLVVVKEVSSSELKKNDIIAYQNEDDTVTTHRIVDFTEENDETKLVTKGDNNNINDEKTVSLSQVEGLYQFKVAKLGNVAMFIQTPTGIIAILSIPIALIIIMQFIQSRKDKKEIEELKKIAKKEKNNDSKL